MKNRIATGMQLAGAAAFAVLLLGQPSAAVAGFAGGMQLCLQNVLPALFPFFVVSGWLMQIPFCNALALPLRPLARAWGLCSPSAPMILLLSWVGGYAVCANLTGIALRNGTITLREAQQLLVLGCCSGPGFVVGCVGGLMLGSAQLGGLLYGLQIAANLLAAALLAILWPAHGDACDLPAVHAAARAVVQQHPSLAGAIRDAVDSSLTVCGCVLFFRIADALLEPMLRGLPSAVPWLRAGLEITAGCSTFSALGGRTALYGVCLCLSILGVSVAAQLHQLTGGMLPMGRFWLSRLIHLGFLQLLIRLCAPALAGQLAVYNSLQPRLIVAARMKPDTAMLMFAFLCAVLYKIGRKIYNKLWQGN